MNLKSLSNTELLNGDNINIMGQAWEWNWIIYVRYVYSISHTSINVTSLTHQQISPPAMVRPIFPHMKYCAHHFKALTQWACLQAVTISAPASVPVLCHSWHRGWQGRARPQLWGGPGLTQHSKLTIIQLPLGSGPTGHVFMLKLVTVVRETWPTELREQKEWFSPPNWVLLLKDKVMAAICPTQLQGPGQSCTKRYLRQKPKKPSSERSPGPWGSPASDVGSDKLWAIMDKRGSIICGGKWDWALKAHGGNLLSNVPAFFPQVLRALQAVGPGFQRGGEDNNEGAVYAVRNSSWDST